MADDTSIFNPDSAPAWQIAADNHNLGNTGKSWFDPETWTDAAGNALKFTASALTSGVASIYNSGVTLGNILGGDFEEVKVKELLSDFDSDLGKYYQENQASVDTIGFIITSLAPGIGGIKVLNAGQKALAGAVESGVIGENLARATGLLPSQTNLYIRNAAREIVSNQATFSAINQSGIKALASGAWQNVLEGVAFETMVQATMFKSPVLEQQDAGDIAWNIALGGAVGGVLGGALQGVGTYRGIYKLADRIEEKYIRPFGSRATIQETGDAADSIILNAWDRDVGAKPVPGSQYFTEAETAYKDRVTRINQDIRDNIHKLSTDKNTETANALADVLQDANHQRVMEAMLHADEVGSIGTRLKIETEIAKFAKENGGQVPVDKHVSYVKLHGEGAGTVLDTEPIAATLADKLAPIKDKSMQEIINDSVRAEKFGFKKAWNIVDASKSVGHYGIEKRYIWADNLIDGVPENATVHQWDLPVLQRAWKDEQLAIKLTDKSGAVIKDGFANKEELYQHIIATKEELTSELLKAGVKSNQEIAKITDQTLARVEGTLVKEGKGYFANKEAKEAYEQTLKATGRVPASLSGTTDPRYIPSYAKIGKTLPPEFVGSPLNTVTAYHGTNKNFTNFDISKTVDGVIHFSSNPEIANRFAVSRAMGESGANIHKVSINTSNFKKVPISSRAEIEQAKFEGYEGLNIKNEHYVVFNEDRLSYNNTISGHVIDGLTFLKQKQVKHEQDVERVIARHASELLQAPKLTQAHLTKISRQGAGPGLVTSADGTYGSPKEIVNMIGSVTTKIQERFRKDTQSAMEGALAAVGRNQEAAMEWHILNQKVTRSGKLWVKDPDGQGLITKELSDALKAGKEIDEIPDDAFIAFKNPEVADLVNAHMDRTGSRRIASRELRAAQGLEDHKDPDVFQPIRPNPSDYPHVAFVKDPRVTGTGHTSMIFAQSERQLSEMMAKVPSEYKVWTKKDAEDFYKARNEYEFQRTLHENYIDSNLANKGVMSEFFTKTDPQKIINDTLQQHLRDDDILARELVKGRNQAAFDYILDLGEAYSKYSGQIGKSQKVAEATAKNPFNDYVRTALNISKINEYPFLRSLNKTLDEGVSKVVGMIKEIGGAAKKPEDLDKINSILAEHGMDNAYSSAATVAWANHTAPKGELTKFVRISNAILSKLTLGMDPLNALTNGISANILRGTELKQITDAIKAGDTELAGQLGNLLKVKLPGVEESINSPVKLVGQAINNFFKDSDKVLMQKYKNLGVVKGYTEQFKQIMDDFTLKGTESVSELNTRLQRAFKTANELSETGEKLTGNKFVEEFNRFVSANVMDQLTSLGVKKGLLTEAEANAYINTFVNRVEGNTIASQRPMIFQGPVGQAIGLFQSYQFNLMQQMFRYVAEGTSKDAAMLLGLQGTFYGLQGLPAFNFINQHIVGSLSGNVQHKDLYDTTYGAAGKQMGEWLMYGLPSNLLHANLYSRGDINPRHLTVIPTSLPDIPIVQAYGKFFGSMKDTLTRIGNGAPLWESFLQGMEHNGISRPMAGIAQTMQALGNGGNVFSTTTKGSILYSNDLASWATAVRIAGGRPLDEAIVNDGVYRINAYQQMDQAKLDNLSKAVKTASANGQMPDADRMSVFAEKYAEAGGKQQGFNKFVMHNFIKANTPESYKISASLSHPYAQKMQYLMDYGDSSFAPVLQPR